MPWAIASRLYSLARIPQIVEVRVYILFCRRSHQSDGVAEQVFLIKENAERKQEIYQAQYKDETIFYIKDFVIEDLSDFINQLIENVKN